MPGSLPVSRGSADPPQRSHHRPRPHRTGRDRARQSPRRPLVGTPVSRPAPVVALPRLLLTWTVVVAFQDLFAEVGGIAAVDHSALPFLDDERESLLLAIVPNHSRDVSEEVVEKLAFALGQVAVEILGQPLEIPQLASNVLFTVFLRGVAQDRSLLLELRIHLLDLRLFEADLFLLLARHDAIPPSAILLHVLKNGPDRQMRRAARLARQWIQIKAILDPD